jgi:nicotinate-nucleotide adenylyltransferase
MKIGLYFGSFNPIHIGHLAIAQHFINEKIFDKILFVVSPQNPFKDSNDLMDGQLRLEMVNLSIKDNPNFECCDIEFNLPLPSYTYMTLEALKSQFINDDLSVIMGSDSLVSLPQWHQVDTILKCKIVVYKRNDFFDNPYPNQPNISIIEAPLVNISATFIRQLLKQNKSIRYLVKDSIIPLLKK